MLFLDPTSEVLSAPSHDQLLSSGRTVVAAVRTPERAQEVLGASGLKEGLQEVRG